MAQSRDDQQAIKLELAKIAEWFLKALAWTAMGIVAYMLRSAYSDIVELKKTSIEHHYRIAAVERDLGRSEGGR